jgi:hypothetical protein
LMPLAAHVAALPGAREPSLVWLALDDVETAALPTPIRTILRRVVAGATPTLASRAAQARRRTRLPVEHAQ